MAEDGLDLQGDVLIGSNEELFLAGGNHSVLQFADGTRKPNSASLANMKENLLSRRNKADKGGFRLMCLVAPEKYYVHRADFPIKNPHSIALSYINAGCEGVVYPLHLLTKTASESSYYKTDTHWTAHGLIRIAGLIAKHAGVADDRWRSVHTEMMDALKPAPTEFVGDLGRKLTPPRGETRWVLLPRHQVVTHENGMKHDYDRPVNDGRLIVVESSHPTAAQTLLIFGDSYLFHALSTLSYVFKRIVFCRTRFYHDEMVVMVNPDMVVNQAAERYLGFVYPDAAAPPFLMPPSPLGRNPEFTVSSAQATALALAGGRNVDLAPFQPR